MPEFIIFPEQHGTLIEAPSRAEALEQFMDETPYATRDEDYRVLTEKERRFSFAPQEVADA